MGADTRMESQRPQLTADRDEEHNSTFTYCALLLLIVLSMRENLGAKAVYWFLISFISIHYLSRDWLGKSRSDRFLGSLFLSTLVMAFVVVP